MQDSVNSGVASSSVASSSEAFIPAGAVAAPAPHSVSRTGFTPRQIGWSAGVVVIGILATVAGVRIARSLGQVNDTGHILPGVQIAGMPVGGMTPDEAKNRVRSWAREKMNGAVTLTGPVSGKTWNLTVGDVGGRFETDEAVAAAVAVGRKDSLWEDLMRGGADRPANVPVAFRLNESQLDKQIARIGQAVYVAPKNARAKTDDTGEISVAAPEVKGLRLDADATRKALLNGNPDSLREGGKATLVIVEEQPRITADTVRQMTHKLGTFRTYYGSSSSNRRHNVEKATGLINGTLLEPGQVFSYNDIVGPREPKLGWLEAPTIADGKLVPGPGGGVCQVSTTLYNAVRKANMAIVARTGHSKPVHYVEPGMDATVAYGDIDFKFRNSKSYPVLVLGQTKGGDVIFSVFGNEASDSEATEPTEEKPTKRHSAEGHKHPARTSATSTAETSPAPTPEPHA